MTAALAELTSIVQKANDIYMDQVSAWRMHYVHAALKWPTLHPM